jgi:hypothetical protein
MTCFGLEAAFPFVTKPAQSILTVVLVVKGLEEDMLLSRAHDYGKYCL